MWTRRARPTPGRFFHVYRWRLLTKIVVGVTAIMMIVLIVLFPTALERRKMELEEYVSRVFEVVWRSADVPQAKVEKTDDPQAKLKDAKDANDQVERIGRRLERAMTAVSAKGPFESSGVEAMNPRVDMYLRDQLAYSTAEPVSPGVAAPEWILGDVPSDRGIENPSEDARALRFERAFGAKLGDAKLVAVLSFPRKRIDDAAWNHTVRLFFVGVGIVACMDIAIVLYLYMAVLLPLRRITAANEALARGKLAGSHIPVREIPLDEIGNIMATHNLMLTGLEDVLSRLRHAKQDAEESRGMLHQNYLVLEEIKEDLEDKNRRLRELDRMKSEFLANMTHELRTPLTSIIGFTDLTLRTPGTSLSDPSRQNLQRVKESAGILLQMINDLLDLSKIESGKMTLVVEPVDIGELAQEIADVVDPLAKQKGLALSARVEGNPAATRIATDRLKVRQIVLNLLGNAIKFTEAGAVEVIVRPVDDAVEIAVRDTGIGIAPEDVPKIFEAFRQLDGSSTRKHGGTGLGLSIVKKLASLLGGEVTLDSAPGKGSTFRVRLPSRSDTTAV
ncbi:MAG: hypothetical protein HY292_20060 [Planctomycetes bacterium]|nr:hypothetical protein [Planctomycetota bacterium]